MTFKDLTSVQTEQLRSFVLALIAKAGVPTDFPMGAGFKLWPFVEAWYRKYDIMRANLFDYGLFCGLPSDRRSEIYQGMGYVTGQEVRVPRCICAGCVIASFEHGDPEFADNLKWFQLANCASDERMWLIADQLFHRKGNMTNGYSRNDAPLSDLYLEIPFAKLTVPQIVDEFEKIMAKREASPTGADALSFAIAAGPFTTEQLVDSGIEVREKGAKTPTIVVDSFKLLDNDGNAVIDTARERAKEIAYAPSDTLLAAKGFLSEREEVGFGKYGVTLDRNDLGFGDLVQHAKEEAGDLLMYLTAAQDRIKKANDMVQAAIDGHVVLDLNELKEMLK
jgi:hypothetical protein